MPHRGRHQTGICGINVPGPALVFDVAYVVVMGSGGPFWQPGGASRGKDLAYVAWVRTCICQGLSHQREVRLRSEDVLKLEAISWYVFSYQDDLF